MTHISVPILWPPEFLAELDLSNQAKDKDAPTALILTASINFDGSLTDPPVQFFILTIAKTHRVVCHTIQQTSDIQQEIAALAKDRVELLVLNAHGSDSSMSFSEENLYDPVDPGQFHGLPDKAAIFLHSCFIGKNLAQRVANALPQTVFASRQKLIHIFTCLSHCQKHQRLEMRSYSEGVQHVLQFKQNQPPDCCGSSQSDDNAYFLELQSFLMKRALAGDALAQFDLGYFNDVGDQPAEAKKWYKLAAMQGYSAAQENLGRHYLKKVLRLKTIHQKPFDDALIQKIERNREKANFWFQKAADQNEPKSQYYLGDFFEEDGDLPNAELYFCKAAERGLAAAQIKLGDLYLKKMRSLQSKPEQSSSDLQEISAYRAKVYKCYRKAANQGHLDAPYFIAHLYESERNVHKAKKWYRLAEGQGHPDARKKLERLENLRADDLPDQRKALPEALSMTS